MAVFANTEKMYEVLGTLFNTLMNHLLSDRNSSSPTSPSNLPSTIRRIIWLTPEKGVICGDADLKPTIDMTLSGDTCHQFWLQEVSMPIALAKGLIKAKGPLPKFEAASTFETGLQAYPEISRKYGL